MTDVCMVCSRPASVVIDIRHDWQWMFCAFHALNILGSDPVTYLEIMERTVA